MCLFLNSFASATGASLKAQNADQGKPPVYTYISEWAVPRAQWAEMVKVDEQDRSLMDKLVADGTLTGYGAYTNLIHQEGEPTHGTWFTATSEGNLLKALEAVYAQPGTTTAPVQGASKHWDYMLVGRVYNQRPGKSEGGYLAGDQWDVKPGEMRAYNDLVEEHPCTGLREAVGGRRRDLIRYGYGRFSHAETRPGHVLLHNARYLGIR